MGGWLVVAGLLAVVAMCWLDARPSSWWYSRRAFEEPVELPPGPLDEPLLAYDLPGFERRERRRRLRGVLSRPLRELEGRGRGRSS